MKITIRFFLALLLTGAVVQAAPQSPLTVAVFDFKSDTKAGNYGDKVTTLVTANLTTGTNFVLVDRANLKRALKEQAFDVSGMANPATAAKIGQITGAKVLVAGKVMTIGANHLVVVANVVGTETGRLFADQAEGAADHLMDLTSALSRKIAQTISDQATNLVAATQESSEERLDRIIKNLAGTNRPSVSIKIGQSPNPANPSKSCEAALGKILMKAGFKVVDEKSDSKPDIEITGVKGHSPGPRRKGMYSITISINLKVQDRRTGALIAYDHEVASAAEASMQAANDAALDRAVDALAEKVLPLLAK